MKELKHVLVRGADPDQAGSGCFGWICIRISKMIESEYWSEKRGGPCLNECGYGSFSRVGSGVNSTRILVCVTCT